MGKFQHQLWGYQIQIPEGWQHKQFAGRDGFALDISAFETGYQGDTLAQLLIHGEWNSLGKPVLEIWQGHLGKVSLMLGAKKLASAAWEMAGARGYETEILLPKKNPQRLWTGILENGMLVLSFLALHWKDKRGEMEPVLSGMIASLAYLQGIESLIENEQGLPLPSGAETADPLSIVPDIPDPEHWLAYQTPYTPGMLQAFYLRELPRYGWDISRYVPYPNPGAHPFARILMEKSGQGYSLGLLPNPDVNDACNLVLKMPGSTGSELLD